MTLSEMRSKRNSRARGLHPRRTVNLTWSCIGAWERVTAEQGCPPVPLGFLLQELLAEWVFLDHVFLTWHLEATSPAWFSMAPCANAFPKAFSPVSYAAPTHPGCFQPSFCILCPRDAPAPLTTARLTLRAGLCRYRWAAVFPTQNLTQLGHVLSGAHSQS
jgi:hypothetical protein